MRRLTSIRLAAVLLPSSLLLHEGAYALAGGVSGRSHDYFALFLPILAVAAVSLAVAAILLPALGFGVGDDRVRSRPFAIALALIVLFAVQEGAEALLFGGGAAQVATAVAAAWALLPLALMLGVVGAGLIELLERAGDRLARLLERRRQPRPRPVNAPRPAALNRTSFAAGSPLAFGLARRPPPLNV
jgi:hypothetical protein